MTASTLIHTPNSTGPRHVTGRVVAGGLALALSFGAGVAVAWQIEAPTAAVTIPEAIATVDTSYDYVERVRVAVPVGAASDTSYDYVERLRVAFPVGAASDTSYDYVERLRVAVPVGAASDTSYDAVERNRVLFGVEVTSPDTSYEQVERARVER